MTRNKMLRKWNQLANEDSIHDLYNGKKQQRTEQRTNEKRFPIQFALNISWNLDGYGWAHSVLVLTIRFIFLVKRAGKKKKITNWDQLKSEIHLSFSQHSAWHWTVFMSKKKKKLTVTKDLHSSHWIQSQRVSCILFISFRCSRTKSGKKKTKRFHTKRQISL